MASNAVTTGCRIRIRRDSRLFDLGARSGTVLCPAARVGDVLRRYVPGREDLIMSQVDAKEDWLVPLVRLDPCPALPLGEEFAVHPSHFDIVDERDHRQAN